MAETILLVTLEIKPGRTEDFKAATAAVWAKTQQEPDTLRYDYYLSADGTRNVNIEVFRNADAFVFHNRNVADEAAALFETLDGVRIDVIGDANDALRAELADVETKYYDYLGGIAR